jgi:LmbE family N-acetylglucosaminyl deacetylase
MRKTAVFLLAHQDDEFGVFFAVEEAVREGAKAVCLYLTDGRYGRQQSIRRDGESRNVLRRLGVEEADIYFLGSREGFRDGSLYTQLDETLSAVEAILDPISTIHALYVPAWEGGHLDHDAVHLIGAAYAVKAKLLDVIRQFALYRAARNVIGFALFKPLLANGPVQAQLIPWSTRLRYLRLCLWYRSQWKIWTALFPFLVYSYCTKGTQETQGLPIRRVAERPHVGPLLYERYGRISYEKFRTVIEPFVQANLTSAVE